MPPSAHAPPGALLTPANPDTCQPAPISRGFWYTVTRAACELRLPGPQQNASVGHEFVPTQMTRLSDKNWAPFPDSPGRAAEFLFLHELQPLAICGVGLAADVAAAMDMGNASCLQCTPLPRALLSPDNAAVIDVAKQQALQAAEGFVRALGDDFGALRAGGIHLNGAPLVQFWVGADGEPLLLGVAHCVVDTANKLATAGGIIRYCARPCRLDRRRPCDLAATPSVLPTACSRPPPGRLAGCRRPRASHACRPRAPSTPARVPLGSYRGRATRCHPLQIRTSSSNCAARRRTSS